MSRSVASTIVALLILAGIAIILGGCAAPDGDWAEYSRHVGEIVQ